MLFSPGGIIRAGLRKKNTTNIVKSKVNAVGRYRQNQAGMAVKTIPAIMKGNPSGAMGKFPGLSINTIILQ
jgi:hypothetical protein